MFDLSYMLDEETLADKTYHSQRRIADEFYPQQLGCLLRKWLDPTQQRAEPLQRMGSEPIL